MRRMVRDVLTAALCPSALLPSPDTWLARMFDRLDQISVENRAIQETGQTLILVGQGLLRLRNIDDDLRWRVGKIITARNTEYCDICTSLRRLALDEAESAAPRAQREILEIALLLETGRDAFVAWPAGFRNLSFERMSS